jgi:hypothetical protein
MVGTTDADGGKFGFYIDRIGIGLAYGTGNGPESAFYKAHGGDIVAGFFSGIVLNDLELGQLFQRDDCGVRHTDLGKGRDSSDHSVANKNLGATTQTAG